MDSQQLEAMNAMVSTMQMFGTIIGLIGVVAMWKLFSDAGEAGWKALVPFYNLYTLMKLATGNGWMFLIAIIPFIGAAYICYKVAQAWGKGIGFTIGLLFLYPVFILLLAFGGAEYRGPQGANL